MYYHAIATLPGSRRKSLVNKSEDQILTDYVIPFVRTGTIAARWGTKVQSYQVLELRIYGTQEAWHKGSGTPLDEFIGTGARNRYPTFEARARKALSTTAHRVFVIMPIEREHFGTQDEQRILKEYDSRFETIETLLGKYDAVAIRIDKEHTLDELVKRIKDEIRRSKFVIADFTDERPSCYYEAGYAEALNKPVLFVASKESVLNPKTPTKIHFDIHRNVNFFVNNEQLRQKLKAALDKNRVQLFVQDSTDEGASVRSANRTRRARRKAARVAKLSRPRPEKAPTGATAPATNEPVSHLTVEVLNEKEKALLRNLATAPAGLRLTALAAVTFPKVIETKASSWTRNSVRKPLRLQLITRVGRGTYKLTTAGHRRVQLGNDA